MKYENILNRKHNLLNLKRILKKTQSDYGQLLGNYGVVKQSNIQILNIIDSLMRKGDKILDVGCGSGFLLYALSKLHEGDFYGLDKYVFSQYGDDNFASDNIEKLRSFCSNNGIDLMNVDAETDSFPFENNYFDISYSKAVIEHFHRSPRKMLMESYRTLKQGGYFILSTPNLTKIERRILFLFGGSIYPGYPKFYNYDGIYTGHIREHTMKEAIYAVKNAGFTIIDSFYVINPPAKNRYKEILVYLLKKARKSFGDILFVIAQKE